ncbi:MAG: CDP-glycerol glycerophosphotransferase family protein [Propionibacteriaceae bacterium]|jgi:CDP-ribitol ribitolphosphotransferase|nr:CDP-glycerol glycerophosphotransferase family protein [Propionibacteriaceae bacterium]
MKALACWLHPYAQRLHNAVYTVAYAVGARTRPMKPDSVLLLTNRGDVLSDNLLYIDRALDHDAHAVTTIFLTQRPSSVLARVWRDLRVVWTMAQTQYTIIDDFLPLVYTAHLRPGARLVQVWHALGAFKRVGYSRGGRDGGPPPTSISHKNYTDVIVSSDSVRPNYAEAFGVTLAVVHATGVPRTDLFFDPVDREAASADLHRRVPQLKGKRVILFAPTFRGQNKRTATYPEAFLDLERIGARLGPDDLFVIRMHPFVTRTWPIPEAYRESIIDLSGFPEFNHLLLAADVLVTDYSSAIFDYALLHRPIVFYVPDLEQYVDQRGFYYDMERYLYGPVARDLPQLRQCLAHPTIDEDKWTQFCATFLNRCDGQATSRFMETIFAE